VPVKDIDSARSALRASELAELIGLAECAWLDVKEGVYQLEDPAGAEELAKDAAAFANAPSGGLLLVGFSTVREDGEEIIAALRPVPRGLVDTDRYRKLIRERVIPPPRGLAVDWVDCGDGKGVLISDVPAQPPARLPRVVPGPSRTPRVSRLSVAVPVREADGTHWLPQPELQRLLAAGWTATGGPSEEVLSSLIDRAVLAARQDQAPPAPALQPGQGDPAWARRFQEVAAAVSAEIPLGAPTGEVYGDGPGVAQHFDGTASSHSWVLAALPRHKPVMVADPVWEALREIGSGAPGGWALEATGFPVLAASIPPAGRVISSAADRVELAGGTWGPGFLVRDSSSGQDWRWEPARAFSLDITRASRNWTAGPRVPQLRLRAVATLPWAVPDLAITAAAHRNLRESLPSGKLAETITALSLHHGADLRAAQWQPGQTGQSRDRASYACTVSAPDGRPALSAEVMLALPNALDSSVVTCAELRVQDFTAWSEALGHPAEPGAWPAWLRLTVDDVFWFFTAAWHTATEVLPTAVTADPAAVSPAGRPMIELHRSAEHPHEAAPGHQRQLSDVVDLTAWGTSDRDPIPEMSVTITAPTRLKPDDRQRTTREAMIYMAEAYGFLNASETW
jgi:hypothetical protein